MKKAHTPGPWLLDNSKHADNIDDGYHFIDAGKGFHNGNDKNGFCIAGCMSLADARLMAAAPDLFELVETANHGSKGSHTTMWQERARAAIAKARGAA